jgi:chromosome segregation ATPase
MTTEHIILSAAARNDDLIRILGETDYAPSALRQTTVYVKELQSQIAAEEKNVKVLGYKLQKEQSEHEAYRDSRMKRLAYKMSGQKEKFAAKAEKEEREYHDALQAKFQAERKLETLKRSLDESQASKDEYEKVNARHESAQVELDALYDSIFSGSTPDFPQEDAAEGIVNQAQNVYNVISGKLNAETQVVKLLSDADKKMNIALQDMRDALSASRMDMWGGGSLLTHIAERDSLSRAQSQASNAEMLVDMARNTQPLIQPVRIEIAQPNFVSNVLFDNIITDLVLHDQIKASKMDLERAHASILSQLQAAQERVKALKSEARRVDQDLQAARRHLRKTRQEAFERVTTGGGSTEEAVGGSSQVEPGVLLPDVPPPAYPDPPAY